MQAFLLTVLLMNINVPNKTNEIVTISFAFTTDEKCQAAETMLNKKFKDIYSVVKTYCKKDEIR